jgi:Tfp pilus assembly protein PilZ
VGAEEESVKERRTSIRFDKAFPVYLAGEEGITRGIARNISEGGMFIETREPYRLGACVRVTFVSPDTSTEITLSGEVRFQCFLSYGSAAGATGESQLRGMGVRFVEGDAKEVGLTGFVSPERASARLRVLH